MMLHKFIRRVGWASWHIDGEDGETLCGLNLAVIAEYERAAELPLAEKSCETCLRLEGHDGED